MARNLDRGCAMAFPWRIDLRSRADRGDLDPCDGQLSNSDVHGAAGFDDRFRRCRGYGDAHLRIFGACRRSAASAGRHLPRQSHPRGIGMALRRTALFFKGTPAVKILVSATMDLD